MDEVREDMMSYESVSSKEDRKRKSLVTSWCRERERVHHLSETLEQTEWRVGARCVGSTYCTQDCRTETSYPSAKTWIRNGTAAGS